ncbi:MAG: hypothetical protein WKG07_05255 [Hymenobacter sp.]
MLTLNSVLLDGPGGFNATFNNNAGSVAVGGRDRHGLGHRQRLGDGHVSCIPRPAATRGLPL